MILFAFLVLQRYVAESPREVDNELALKGLHRLAQGNQAVS